MVLTEMPTKLEPTLQGLRVALDVQHLFRDPPHEKDRGAVFRVPVEGYAKGMTIRETDVTTAYVDAAAAMIAARGGRAFTNDVARGVMVGPYSRRHRAAASWAVHAYVACHVNAGGGSYALALFNRHAPRGRAFAQALARAMRDVAVMQPGAPIIDHVARAVGPGDRGWSCIGGFGVTERPETPAAAIFEPCFGDNPRHHGLILSPGPSQVIALGLVRGLEAWWKAARSAQ